MKIAGAPISWGVCEVPGWGFQLAPERVLKEMTEVGLAATEFGPQGWLPIPPAERAAAIVPYGLQAVGAFVPVVLHDPDHDPLPEVDRELDSFAAAGGDVLVLAASSGLDGYDIRPVLDATGWETVFRNLDRLSELAASRGVRASLHPHVGTMVETADDVQRVLEGSNVSLCLDTGHLLIGGTDPAELARRWASRVNHVHAKDVRADLARRVQSGELTYTDAVRQGIYVPLGTGDVDFAAIVAALEAVGFDGWYVLEQDTILAAEPQDEGPVADVRSSIAYLRSLDGAIAGGGVEVTEAAETPLGRMTRQNPQTALWNDSSDPSQLRAAIGWGAVGATCNPVIALAVINADLPRWTARIRALADERPTAREDEIGWRLVEELSVDAARLLEPAFAAHGGRNGRLSIQTDPRLHRDVPAIVAQAVHFSELAPNIVVKIPATKAGVEAIEEATFRGVSVNATVSFTVSQAIAVAEAVERGLDRRTAAGLPTEDMGPVATIMGGRLDDWLKTVAGHQGVLLTPGVLDWAGVATLKQAYRIFQERGYRTRVLSAAFRNHLQLAELVGGDLVISPPFEWQRRINDSGIDLQPRIDVPVDVSIVDELARKLPEFSRAYEPDGLAPEEFEAFGATRRTLRQFLDANAQLEAIVRDVLIPAC